MAPAEGPALQSQGLKPGIAMDVSAAAAPAEGLQHSLLRPSDLPAIRSTVVRVRVGCRDHQRGLPGGMGIMRGLATIPLMSFV